MYNIDINIMCKYKKILKFEFREFVAAVESLVLLVDTLFHLGFFIFFVFLYF